MAIPIAFANRPRYIKESLQQQIAKPIVNTISPLVSFNMCRDILTNLKFGINLRVALVTTMFYKLIATYRNLYNVAEF